FIGTLSRRSATVPRQPVQSRWPPCFSSTGKLLVTFAGDSCSRRSPMRFLLSAPLILLVSATLGCGNDGLGGLPGIPVSLDISDHKIPGFAPPSAQASCAVNVPGSGALSTDSLQPISFDLKSSRELQGQSVLRFTKVKLEHVDLNVIPPSQAGQTWDFLDSIRLFADVPGRGDPPVLV